MHNSAKNIKIAFFLNLAFSIFELFGGMWVNSVSVISDSIHDFGDALSIGLSWILDKKSTKKPNKKYTFGYLRFSVLGALINSVILLSGSLVMLYNAVLRILNPEPIDYNGLIFLAIIGLAVNGFGAFRTAKGHAISEKVISLHLIEDVLGWALVLICSIFMRIFDVSLLDPILSIAISLFILVNVFRNLRKIFEVFLEKAPADIDIDSIKKDLLKDYAIKDIHHIHLWTMDSINKYLTAHIVLSEEYDAHKIVEIKNNVREYFNKQGIAHTGLEFEFPFEDCKSTECDISKLSIEHSGEHHHHHLH